MTDITTTRGRPETGAPTTYNQRAAAPTRWSADADRTSVDFAVKTFWGLLTVRGHFDRFSGSYEVGPDGGRRIELTIDADSLDTGNAKRDEHLRSTDFFAIDEFPHVRFTSTGVRESGDGTLRVAGDLHAVGKTVAIDLDATVAQLDDGWLEIEATTTVDQRRLGMSNGLLGMIRRPATLRVKAPLSTADDAAANGRS
jgi:polyisoprenoid-binding protein YceI